MTQVQLVRSDTNAEHTGSIAFQVGDATVELFQEWQYGGICYRCESRRCSHVRDAVDAWFTNRYARA